MISVKPAVIQMLQAVKADDGDRQSTAVLTPFLSLILKFTDFYHLFKMRHFSLFPCIYTEFKIITNKPNNVFIQIIRSQMPKDFRRHR